MSTSCQRHRYFAVCRAGASYDYGIVPVFLLAAGRSKDSREPEATNILQLVLLEFLTEDQIELAFDGSMPIPADLCRRCNTEVAQDRQCSPVIDHLVDMHAAEATWHEDLASMLKLLYEKGHVSAAIQSWLFGTLDHLASRLESALDIYDSGVGVLDAKTYASFEDMCSLRSRHDRRNACSRSGW